MFELKGFQGQRLKRTFLRNRKLSAKHNGKLLKRLDCLQKVSESGTVLCVKREEILRQKNKRSVCFQKIK